MNDNGKDETTFGLVVSFEDQSESYVNGWEAGVLWERMKSGMVAEIEMVAHTANKETFNRMAIAEGWDITCTPTEYEEWMDVKMEKRSAPPARPNPHGLRIV